MSINLDLLSLLQMIVSNQLNAGIRRDDIEIHLQWHDAKEWDLEVNRPMLRIVTENVDILFQEYNFKNVFNKDTKVRNTDWGTKEFAFYDIDKNGLVFYQNNG